MTARRRQLTFALALVFALHGDAGSVVRADEVLDWNAIAIRCVFVAPAVGGAMQPRMLAIVPCRHVRCRECPTLAYQGLSVTREEMDLWLRLVGRRYADKEPT